MQEQITNNTTLASLAKHANANGEWWKEGALDQRNALELPTRVLVALENAGITTVEELRKAGPNVLREIPHLGKQAFDQIIELLRALDRETNGGGSRDHQSGQTTLR
jgi:DNA-directed RNA polymerase alpha subunit